MSKEFRGRCASVTYERKFNLGNYESETITLKMVLDEENTLPVSGVIKLCQQTVERAKSGKSISDNQGGES